MIYGSRKELGFVIAWCEVVPQIIRKEYLDAYRTLSKGVVCWPLGVATWLGQPRQSVAACSATPILAHYHGAIWGHCNFHIGP